jgi:micrococcal nuclease
MKNLILAGVALLLSSFVYLNVCNEYNAHVLYVYDGDTITVDAELGFSIHKEEKLRFARINTPELKGSERPQGLIARDALRELIDGKDITFTDEGTGKYGRTIAEVYYDTINVNDWLVRNGYAEYRSYD